MPLIRIEDLGSGTRLALWRMSESVDELPRPQIEDFSTIKAEARLKEKLTEYCLLKALTSRGDILISHYETGQPYIDGCNISISHTRGWAAMILSSHHRVGIDIEYYSDRVNRIADRFIRPDEQNDNLQRRLINWCAKETIYKLLSEEDLQYFEMRLAHFDIMPEGGDVEVDDLKKPKSRRVQYRINDDYVLTYSVET